MKWMRPKICVPIVAPIRDGIIREAKQIAKLPVEWWSGALIFLPVMREKFLMS